LLAAGTVVGGARGTNELNIAAPGVKGSAFGSGLFIQGTQSVTLAPAAGQTLAISGVIADQSGSGGTGINAGAGTLVIGGSGGAVVLDATNTFTGGIIIQDGTLDLAQTGAAGAGSISFDPSADPTLEFTATTVPTTPIDNFQTGDFLQIDSFAVTGHAYSNGTLTLDGAGGPLDIKLPGVADPAGLTFSTLDGTTTVGLLCFLAGTLIATQDGQVPVEHLRAGDMVMTARGAVRPIEWIGTGQVLAARGRRNAATPVIVQKGALADNIPCHDLRITKGHALFVDDVLIPVECLINHRNILWDDLAQEVSVYHVELATHDVLLANGAPAESYRDDGNRWLFQNANSGWDQPAEPPCAPVLTGGAVVDAVWRRLLDRSGPRPGLPLTEDPDVHLLLDGNRLDAASRHGSTYVFRLPDRPSAARLISRVGSPAELGTTRDPRPLGVPLRRIALRQGMRMRVMEADDPTLAEGFHGFEPDDSLRWTNGDASLPAALFAGLDGPMELELHVAGTTSYVMFGDPVRSLAA
jgi:autotransporter-associated beta strand protein